MTSNAALPWFRHPRNVQGHFIATWWVATRNRRGSVVLMPHSCRFESEAAARDAVADLGSARSATVRKGSEIIAEIKRSK